MKDEEFLRDLRALLLEDASPIVPSVLRARISAIPEAHGPRSLPATLHRKRLLGLVAGLAVVLLGGGFVFLLARSPAIEAPASAAPGLSISVPGPTTAATNPLAPLFEVAGGGLPVTGDDGTIYLASSSSGPAGQGEVYAFDRNGRIKPGWPFAPPAIVEFETPLAGPDGVVYVVGQERSVNGGTRHAELWALDGGGNVRTGWPQAADGYVGLGLGPQGTVYLSTQGTAAGGQSELTITALDAAGVVRSGWPQVLRGSLSQNPAFGPDGTLYALIQPATPSATAQLVALGQNGATKAGWPMTVPNGGFLVGPNGLVYVWSFDISGAAGTTPGGPRITRTQFLALDPAGTVHAGWPITIDGPAGVPTVGSDGTLFTTAGQEGASEHVLAIGPDGAERAGWPYSLPAGISAWPYSPQEGLAASATSPTVAPDGSLLLAIHPVGDLGKQGILALDADGQVRAGWPIWLAPGEALAWEGGFATGGGSNLVPPVFGADGTIYLALDAGGNGRIEAIGPEGRERWRFTPTASPPHGELFVALAFTSDGKLLATAKTDSNTTTLVYVLGSDG